MNNQIKHFYSTTDYSLKEINVIEIEEDGKVILIEKGWKNGRRGRARRNRNGLLL